MDSWRLTILAFVCVISTIRVARADVPPPDGYVEKCVVELEEQPGTRCEACLNNGLELGTVCEKKYAGTKFTYVCKTWGGGEWTEVWCDGPPRPDDAPTTSDDETGCSCSIPGLRTSAIAGASIGIGGLALCLVRRRKRSR